MWQFVRFILLILIISFFIKFLYSASLRSQNRYDNKLDGCWTFLSAFNLRFELRKPCAFRKQLRVQKKKLANTHTKIIDINGQQQTDTVKISETLHDFYKHLYSEANTQSENIQNQFRELLQTTFWRRQTNSGQPTLGNLQNELSTSQKNKSLGAEGLAADSSITHSPTF